MNASDRELGLPTAIRAVRTYRRHLLRSCRINASTVQGLSGKFRRGYKASGRLRSQSVVVKRCHRSIGLVVGGNAAYCNAGAPILVVPVVQLHHQY